MATTAKRNSTSGAKAADGKPTEKPVGDASAVVTQGDATMVEAAAPPVKRRLTMHDIDVNELVEVQSCCYGELIYISRKTGYRVQWPEFGTIQPLTVDELITMRNSQPAFFRNGWVRFVGDNAKDIAHYLQVDRYFAQDLPYEQFDDVYELSPEQILTVVGGLSNAMKESIARRAIDLINDGTIDSRKKIEAIETATGFILSE